MKQDTATAYVWGALMDRVSASVKFYGFTNSAAAYADQQGWSAAASFVRDSSRVDTLAHAESLIGERVLVYAPETTSAPEWLSHGCVVRIRGLSPTREGVFATSGGPLEWTRATLRVLVQP